MANVYFLNAKSGKPSYDGETKVYDFPVKVEVSSYGGMTWFMNAPINQVINFVKENIAGRSYAIFDHRTDQTIYTFHAIDGRVISLTGKRAVISKVSDYIRNFRQIRN